MAAVCETLQVHADDESDDSEAGALDDLLGLGGALADVADASDDDAGDVLVDAFMSASRSRQLQLLDLSGCGVSNGALLQLQRL